jgi:hypothetical protein
MSHPDKFVVGTLGLGMAALGLLIAFVALVIVCLNAHRVLPRSRSRRTYWIGMAVLIPLALAACLLTPRFIGNVAVIASFGWDAYADGLRVVNKHGQLSDGRYLGLFWAAAFGSWWFPACFLLSIPVVAWHFHFNPKKTPQGKRSRIHER